MSEEHRKGFYLRARELKEHDVLLLEITEMKRTLYNELALRANSELERQGLRLAMLAINEFQKRLEKVGNMYQIKPLQSLSNKLN
jgi:hypothetical protein